MSVRNFPPITTGFPSLDAALGGGLAMGRIVEFYSAPDAGLASDLAAQVCARGGFTGSLVVSQKAHPEHLDLFDHLLTLCRQAAPGRLIVLDNLHDSIPEHHPDRANHRRDWTRLLRKVANIVAHGSGKGQTLLVCNARHRVPGAFNDTTSGYNALKFYASQRAHVRATNDGVEVRVVKNKMHPPFQTAVLGHLGGAE